MMAASTKAHVEIGELARAKLLHQTNQMVPNQLQQQQLRNGNKTNQVQEGRQRQREGAGGFAGSHSTGSPNSPSSLQSMTTDSDSLSGERQAAALNLARARSPPVQIKYNYYDYNGERQENHDMTQFSSQQQQQQHQHNQMASGQTQVTTSSSKPVQRQLSPTFKQNLDQIVRSSQNLIQQRQRPGGASPNSPSSTGSSSSSPISPTPRPQEAGGGQNTLTLLARRYKLSSYEHRCLRCAKTVYQMDKVGPLKEFTFYHQNCFKCRECGTKLTLKTYFNSQHSSTDLEVYCHRHCPKTPAGKLDNQSVGIRAALNAPKVFDPIHQQQFDANQLLAQQQHQHQPQVDSRALYIKHAVQQTRLQSIYKQSQVDQKISQFLNRRLEFLEPKQKMLEMRHREEEDQLFKVFEQKWHQEERQIRDQIRDEWQQELNKLLDKYKRQLSAASLAGARGQNVEGLPMPLPLKGMKSLQALDQANNNNSRPPPRTIDFHLASSKTASTQQQGEPVDERMINLERMNLEKTMTIKLDRRKETLKRKLREFERQATAELVEKQSREMLTLISLKLEEFKQEQKRKLGSDLEQFEAIESLANHLGASLQVTADGQAPMEPAGRDDEARGPGARSDAPARQQQQQATRQKSSSGGHGPTLPPPRAPPVSKMKLYNSEQADEVFREIDELAINVAKEDQRTFTDLVHALTRHCLSEVEKVRAIFRWITVKNLNTMHFDATVKPDTPLGLLRGIKQGSESYHVLFKRLCSYAGLHCVVIKGFSKSAGYQPGVRFEGNRFRNSWNAVYVAGAWRFVQCNWGARHLVSVAVMQDKNSNSANRNNSNNHRPSSQGRAATRRSGAPAEHQPSASNLGRRALTDSTPGAPCDANGSRHQLGLLSPVSPVLSTSTSSSTYSSHSSASSSSSCPSPRQLNPAGQQQRPVRKSARQQGVKMAPPANDSLRYEYDDHYFLTDPDEFIYEFFPTAPEWQLLRTRPLSLTEFEQLPFVRSLFFKYGLYFPQTDIKSVLYTNSSGATIIKIGMPTHMIPSLIFHYNLKYFDSDQEHHDGVSLKRFVMQSVESGGSSEGQMMLSNIVSFRVHVPENGAYILDIFANSTTPTQYITGEPMKFKSVCKFKIIAKNLKTVMVPLPDCASGEYGPMKATRLFGIIPITHESGLISVQNEKRFVEIQFRMTRPLLDFMASLHKNGYDERQLSKLVKIFIDGDIVFIAIKFLEDGQYGLDIYTRDQSSAAGQQSCSSKSSNSIVSNATDSSDHRQQALEPRKQLLTHCCKYLINVRGSSGTTSSSKFTTITTTTTTT